MLYLGWVTRSLQLGSGFQGKTAGDAHALCHYIGFRVQGSRVCRDTESDL